MKTKTNKVVIVRPVELAGRLAMRNGEPFRYPSQNFWVHPVILDGKKILVLSVKEFPVDHQEGADYINGFLDSKIALNLNPDIVYDYQSLLSGACCPSCGHPVKWTLARTGSDKFCAAECCGIIYGMVPESVRVISIAVGNPIKDELSIADKEFLEELGKLDQDDDGKCPF